MLLQPGGKQFEPLLRHTNRLIIEVYRCTLVRGGSERGWLYNIGIQKSMPAGYCSNKAAVQSDETNLAKKLKTLFYDEAPFVVFPTERRPR